MKIKNIIAGFLSVFIMSVCVIPVFFVNGASDGKVDISDFPSINVDWDAVNEKSYEFTLKSDGTYEISKYIYEIPTTGFLPSDSITLPSSYKGKAVTSIGNRAFCTNKADHITGSITIPSSITSIGNEAFSMGKFNNCVIPSTVTSIGNNAFNDTPWLNNMRAQNPLVIVNNILIDAKTVKGDVVIPEGVTSIPGFTFSENKDVTGVTIPNSVKTIGNSAFNRCESLERINIPNSVTEIGESAFIHCQKLSGTLTIPGSVKTIGDLAFWDCKEITKVVMQDGVIEIGTGAFGCCLSLTDVSIPNTVTTLGKKAFNEAHKLEKVVIPASVTSIGEYCFDYNFKLESVTIKNPNCVIYDDKSTLYIIAVINGYENSTAQAYAQKYDRTFAIIGEVKGDANGDGKLNIRDAAFIAILCAKGQYDDIPECADYNGDGKRNIRDAAAIAVYLATK